MLPKWLLISFCRFAEFITSAPAMSSNGLFFINEEGFYEVRMLIISHVLFQPLGVQSHFKCIHIALAVESDFNDLYGLLAH